MLLVSLSVVLFPYYNPPSEFNRSAKRLSSEVIILGADRVIRSRAKGMVRDQCVIGFRSLSHGCSLGSTLNACRLLSQIPEGGPLTWA